MYRYFRKHKGDAVTLSPAAFCDSRHGTTRRKYEDACASLEQFPLSAEDARVSMFVKPEHWPSDAARKPPRAIQFRNPRFTAEWGRRAVPIEKIVFARKRKSPFVKGMNSWERGARLWSMDKWSDTVFIGLDHSKFDAHVTIPWLRATHAFYKWMNEDPDLPGILKYQLVNRCRSMHNIRYVSAGKRMSGDYDTGLGNSLINFAILSYICAPLGKLGTDYDIILDGDDSVISCSASRLDLLGDIPARCRELAMETKVEEVVMSVFEVQFCQCRLVLVGEGVPRLVRTPYRAISRAVATVKNLQPWEVPMLLTSKGDCELACNNGVPVLQSFALYLKRMGRGAKGLYTKETSYRLHAEGADVAPPIAAEITETARASFWTAFGVDPSLQVLAEKYFDEADDSDYVDALIGLIAQNARSQDYAGLG